MAEQETDQKIKDFAVEIEDNSSIPGVHINPVRLPGETKDAFRRRMYEQKQRALGKMKNPDLPDAPERYEQAFAWFMDGIPEIKDGDKIVQAANKRPTVTEVGLALHLNLPVLLKRSIDRNWEMTRANKDAATELAGNEARLQLAQRVDRAILAKTESVIIKAAEAYDDLLSKAMKLPDDYTQMTELDDPSMVNKEEPKPDDGPRVRTGPKRSRSTLLNNKIGLINDIVKGFMNMCEQSRNVGLLVPPQEVKGGEGGGGLVDSSKLKNLNLTLISLQQGRKNEKTAEATDI